MNPSFTLQVRFLVLLPLIERHARIYFRYVKCPDKKADRIAEAIALSWKWFLKLEERGKDVTQFVSVFARLASRAARNGRRIVGMDRSKDVLSFRAQQRWRFVAMIATGGRDGYFERPLGAQMRANGGVLTLTDVKTRTEESRLVIP